ncbi:MAG: hypothetical protein ACRDDZ_11970 [Marinifilaceae bacterium]
MNYKLFNAIAQCEMRLIVRSLLFRFLILLGVLPIAYTIIYRYTSIINGSNFTFLNNAISSDLVFTIMSYTMFLLTVFTLLVTSDYVQRDKRIDSLWPIMARPFDNEVYVLGKMWGNLQVLLCINGGLLLFGILAVTCFTPYCVTLFPFIFYFITLTIPYLLFISGMMLLLRVLMRSKLAAMLLCATYLFLSIFWAGYSGFPIWNPTGMYFSLNYSGITGMNFTGLFLLERLVYLLLGMALYLFVMFVYPRLAQRRNYGMYFAMGGLLTLFAVMIFIVDKRLIEDVVERRARYVESYIEHRSYSEVSVLSTDLKVQHRDNQISIASRLELCNANATALDCIKLYLNPELQITDIKIGNLAVRYTRNEQVVYVNHRVEQGDTLFLELNYSGTIDDGISFCDITTEHLGKYGMMGYCNNDFSMGDVLTRRKSGDNVGHILRKDYVYLTNEHLWYPLATAPVNPPMGYGVKRHYGQFTIEVINSPLVTVTQGAKTQTDSSVIFRTEHPLPMVTLIMGKYKQLECQVDSCLYGIYYYKGKGHDFFKYQLSAMTDTLPHAIRKVRNMAERDYGLSYLYNRLTLVEIPFTIFTSSRYGGANGEFVWPEVICYQEKGRNISLDFPHFIKSGREQLVALQRDPGTMAETQMNVFRFFTYSRMGFYGLEFLFSGYRGTITDNDNPIISEVVKLWSKPDNPWESWHGCNSRREEALRYLQTYSFQEMVEERPIPFDVNALLYVKAGEMRRYIVAQIGNERFDRCVRALTREMQFSTVDFAYFITLLKEKEGLDISAYYDYWYRSKELPTLLVLPAKVARVVGQEREELRVSVPIANRSDIDAIVSMNSSNGNKHYIVPARSEVEIAYIDGGLLNIDKRVPYKGQIVCGLTNNFPGKYEFNIRDIVITTTDTTEGIMPVPGKVFESNPLDYIVTCEDEGFSIHTKGERRALRDHIAQFYYTVDTSKYVSHLNGMNEWRYCISTHAYGDPIKSFVGRRSGTGNSYAQWKLTVPKNGRYTFYIWNIKDDVHLWNIKDSMLYNYTIQANGDHEKIPFEPLNEDAGWVSIGDFDLTEGEDFIVKLSDKANNEFVMASAIKLELLE